MSDIKIEVKEAIENFHNGKTVNLSNKQLITWLSCFLTTIESLQKENNYNSMLVESYRTQIDQEQVTIEDQNALLESQKEEIETGIAVHTEYMHTNKRLAAEIESLKAITELAVKTLKWYADIDNHLELGIGGTEASIEEGRKARTTLSEIERLQNE